MENKIKKTKPLITTKNGKASLWTKNKFGIRLFNEKMSRNPLNLKKYWALLKWSGENLTFL